MSNNKPVNTLLHLPELPPIPRFRSRNMSMPPLLLRQSLSAYTESHNIEREVTNDRRKNSSTSLSIMKSKLGSKIGSWTGFHRNAQHEEIVTQSKTLCRLFLRTKLRTCLFSRKKLGLQRLKSVLQNDPVENTPPGIEELRLLGSELDRIIPELYDRVLKNVGLKEITTSEGVEYLMQSVCRELFRNDITWGRIVAMYAVTAALAKDCVKMGRTEYLNLLIESLGNFVELNLTHWISQQGGWIAFTDLFHKKRTYHSFQILAFASIILVLLCYFYVKYS